MISLKKVSGAALCAILFLSGAASAALLDGQTVNYQYYFPNLSSPVPNTIADNGNKLVGAGVEVSNLIGNPARGTMDISDSNLFIDLISSGSSVFTAGDFNGFVLTDVFGAIASFTSVSINAATNLAGFDASRVSFDADHIYVNFQGLSFNTNTFVSLDIQGGVPEPATLLLLAFGLAGLGFSRRRHTD